MRRASAFALAAAFIAVGVLGTYSYLDNYYVHRGFAAPRRLVGARPGRLFNVHFYSRSLGRTADYMVYLPAGYAPSRRLAVDYLLHGIPGRPVAFSVIAHIEVRLDNLVSRHRMAPLIMIFPDGRIGGSTFSDSEWANTAAGHYESYVIDVVRDVDARFATVADRQHRVIGGLSAGGYGAINIALHHPSVFGNVQVWSGYFRQARSGVFANATQAALAYNSPVEFARTRAAHAGLAANPLRVFLFDGSNDPSSRMQLRPMVRALQRPGMEIGWAVYPGGHDWGLWNAHLDQMLQLAARDVRSPILPALVRPLPHAHVFHRTQPVRGARHLNRVHSRHAATARRSDAAVSTGTLAPVAFPHAPSAADNHGGAGGLLGGLLLALVSAAAINLGFLLQHRGLRGIDADRGWMGLLRGAFHSRSWLGGQALGCAGFAAQIVAVSIAPLSLVQAFAAGGLALSVPLAAGLFGYRISRPQRTAVLVVAAALATLPIALPAQADQVHTAALLVTSGVVVAVAIALAARRSAVMRAIAAGCFYGVADASIKAVSVSWGAHGASALASGWTVLAVLGTFAGFLAFQSALRDGGAITSISLATALCALVALVCSLLGFGESLGATPAAVLVHLAAIAVVLGCVPTLARAQSELEDALALAPAGGRRAGGDPGVGRLATAPATPYRPWERAAGGE